MKIAADKIPFVLALQDDALKILVSPGGNFFSVSDTTCYSQKTLMRVLHNIDVFNVYYHYVDVYARCLKYMYNKQAVNNAFGKPIGCSKCIFDSPLSLFYYYMFIFESRCFVILFNKNNGVQVYLHSEDGEIHYNDRESIARAYAEIMRRLLPAVKSKDLAGRCPVYIESLYDHCRNLDRKFKGLVHI